MTIHDFLGGLFEILLPSVLCKDRLFGHLLGFLLFVFVLFVQELALGRTCVQMNVVAPLRSLPCEQLKLLNFRSFTTVPEEVLSSKFGLNSIT